MPHWALRCKLMWILVASSRLVGFTQLPMCTAERRRTRQSKWNGAAVTLHDGGVRGLHVHCSMPMDGFQLSSGYTAEVDKKTRESKRMVFG